MGRWGQGTPRHCAEVLLVKAEHFLCDICGSVGCSVMLTAAALPQSHSAHQQTVTPGLCAWVLQARQCPLPAAPAFRMAAAPPTPRPAFLFSRAAEISWILPQDAPSECENSSSARSHGNCSLATDPYLLFSSLHSCERPPRAAHKATTSPAPGTGLPAHRLPYPTWLQPGQPPASPPGSRAGPKPWAYLCRVWGPWRCCPPCLRGTGSSTLLQA